MKTYNVFNKQELDSALDDLKNLYRMAKEVRGKDSAITVKVTKYRKPKSKNQHAAYWKCIGELLKAFREVGYDDVNQEVLHEFIKRKSGFTKVFKGEVITLSIADLSEDATSKELNRLIDFIIRFAAQELNYIIDIGSE